MPSKKHTPEEIIGKLREVEIVLAQDIKPDHPVGPYHRCETPLASEA